MSEAPESGALLDEDATVALLLDLARALHLSYVPSFGVENRVKKAARAWGLEVEVFTLQTLALTEVRSGASRRVDFQRLPFNPHWNLTRAASLLLLSESIARGKRTVAEARAELDRIMAPHQLHPEWLVYLAYGVYGAAVAARVGGGWWELVAALVVGVLAGGIHFGTLKSERLDLQKSFLAAFLGTLLAFGLTFVLPTFDAARALFGGVTLLVPAMVVTLGSAELVGESVEAGISRLTYGLLRFLMLAVGIGAAGTLWRLFGPLPVQMHANALPDAVVLVIIAVGGLALTLCMSARRRDTPWIVGAVLLAWGVQELTKGVFGDKGSPLISAFVLGVAGQLYSRLPERLPSTIIMPGLLQLAPGFVGTRAILALLGVPGQGDDARVFQMLLVALQLVMGLMFAFMLGLSHDARTRTEDARRAKPAESSRHV
ncbi:threonine/serine exporter family protein [Myxococcus sp. CA051A]|uniref:threonine/serine ThrE exporter family protein n=1 Tax=unclassified Myxococcus TaxID=2648731 RepID=UPI00157AF557|nr:MULTISPECIES: threonine/serine exporter family protein [unclassified Myxococcus]NTX33897.1 threonine/serine exporter family protein [Myxococcus sp. CA033]NTX51797.1 threonine/serine exporter family protein [Myxococcus sp. CA039A]NTX65221.1 threonine/serine exporter family protein [Myxococcus sp. CA051A]